MPHNTLRKSYKLFEFMKTYKWITITRAITQDVAVQADSDLEAIEKLKAMSPDKRQSSVAKTTWKYEPFANNEIVTTEQ